MRSRWRMCVLCNGKSARSCRAAAATTSCRGCQLTPEVTRQGEALTVGFPNSSRAGSLRAVARPKLPQIRTCGFAASGSRTRTQAFAHERPGGRRWSRSETGGGVIVARGSKSSANPSAPHAMQREALIRRRPARRPATLSCLPGDAAGHPGRLRLGNKRASFVVAPGQVPQHD
jgi:hypothetical protein